MEIKTYDLHFDVFDTNDTFEFEGMPIANGSHSFSVPTSSFDGLNDFEIIAKVLSYFKGAGSVNNIRLYDKEQ